MATLQLKCVNQELAWITPPEIIYSGNVKIDSVSFEFCPLWDGFTKTTVFRREGEKTIEQLLNNDCVCEIPPEMTKEKGTIFIGVYGDKDDTRRTSREISFFLPKGCATDGVPSNPTPDKYTTILSLLKKLTAELDLIDGTNNVMGSKGFKITAIEKLTDTTGRYYLNYTDGLEVGMSVSVNAGVSDSGFQTITSINQELNFIEVNGFTENGLSTSDDAPEEHYRNNYLIVDGHPELGDIDVGFDAFASGNGNFAQNAFSTAFGNGNKALGKYGAAFGIGNEVGHAGVVGGRSSKALGVSSSAFGENMRILAYCAAGLGKDCYIDRKANNAFVQGHNSQVWAAYASAMGLYTMACALAQTVRGKYNIPDWENKYALIIGNGMDTQHRSNALTLGWDGVLDISGLKISNNLIDFKTLYEAAEIANSVREDADNGVFDGKDGIVHFQVLEKLPEGWNYNGAKVINLEWDDNTKTYKVPSGVTVYVGDTINFDVDREVHLSSYTRRLRDMRLGCHVRANGEGESLVYNYYDNAGQDPEDVLFKDGTILIEFTKDYWGQVRYVDGYTQWLTSFVAKNPSFDWSAYEGTIYLVPKENPENNNLFDEYIVINNKWERLGV